MAKYRISEKAIEDLEQIWLYTFENWSEEQANRYYKLIIEEIEFAADNYKCGISMEHVKKGYRMVKIKAHLVFYRKAVDEIIEVIRILHQRMDIENRLDD